MGISTLRSFRSLLAEKCTACRLQGIEWRFLADEDCGAAGLDGPPLVAILGNALDNAVESLRGQPAGFVEVQFIRQNAVIKISVLNSIHKDQTGDDRLATRKSPDRHGLGLQQISDAAESLGGFVQTKVRSHLFRNDVWLPLPESAA